MERQNYYMKLLCDLNVLSNILPFFGTTVECANLLKKTCSKTRQLWIMHKEAISCVILKGEQNREKLCLENEFDKQIATKLLKYHTYLLYDVKINLESKSSYEAMNYFLDSIDTRVSDTIFIEIDALISTENINEYNKFIQRFQQKIGDGIEIIQTRFSYSLMYLMIRGMIQENVALEYFENVCCPNPISFKVKLVDTLRIVSEFFCIEDLNNINFLYKRIDVTLKNLDILYQNKYTFDHSQAVFINHVVLCTMGEINHYTHDKIKKYLDYIIDKVINLRCVEIMGEDLNLDHLICMVDHINKSRLNHMQLIYEKRPYYEAQNITCIALPNIKFCFYNHKEDKVIVMEAENSEIAFCNFSSCQNDKYIVIGDLAQFSVKSFYTVEDINIVKDMHTIKHFYENDFKSFVAIQYNFKISTSLKSRGIHCRNFVDRNESLIEINCIENYNDYDSTQVIDTIKSLDPKVRVSLNMLTEFLDSIHYAKLLLNAMVGRRLKILNLMHTELDENESEVVLKFLQSPFVNYESYYLWFSDCVYVIHALHAIENRYSFRSGVIDTDEYISEEAEALASKILQTHIYCRLRLNSELKAFQCKF